MSIKTIPKFQFRLFDFQVFNKSIGEGSDVESNFEIQMFGINELGESCAIFVEEYMPFFYIRIDNSWTPVQINSYKEFIKKKVGKKCAQEIESCVLVFSKQH